MRGYHSIVQHGARPASTASAPANASTNGLPPGWELTPSDESLIAEVMENYARRRAEKRHFVICITAWPHTLR